MIELQDLPEGCTLGLNYSGLHDSAIAIVGPAGDILFACALERLSRVKQDGRWPHLLLDRVPWSRIDRIAIATLPHDKALTLGERFARDGWPLPIEGGRVQVAPLGQAWHERIRSLPRPIAWFDHHHAHAASAWFLTGFSRGLVLTCDAGATGCPWVGTVYRAEGDRMELKGGIAHGKHRSPANLYTLVTALLGLRPNRHEGKVTGLSARGKAEPHTIQRFLDVTIPMLEEMDQLLYWDTPPDSAGAAELIVNPALRTEWRDRLSFLSDADLAACVQKSAEAMSRKILDRARELAGEGLEHLCLAGGLFCNVRINQDLVAAGFRSGFIAPPMTDDGVALGAALLGHVESHPETPLRRPEPTMFLGPGIDGRRSEEVLARSQIEFTKPDGLAQEIAEHLAEGQTVAVARGRMEFGPRALGHRSILSSASDASINDELNAKLQRTEFMPFAPLTLGDEAPSCYGPVSTIATAARFMTITVDCTDQLKLSSPAVVHVDGTARPQLVNPDDEPFIHEVLSAYKRRTGIGTLINTSFNIHEEPIVCSEEDALTGFSEAQLDVLVLGDALVLRSGNEAALDAVATRRSRATRDKEGLKRLSRWLCAVQGQLAEARGQIRAQRDYYQPEIRGLVTRVEELEAAQEAARAKLEALGADRSNLRTIEYELELDTSGNDWKRQLGLLRNERQRAWADVVYLKGMLEAYESAKVIRLARLFDRSLRFLPRMVSGLLRALLPSPVKRRLLRFVQRLERGARYGRLPRPLVKLLHVMLPGFRPDSPRCPFDKIDILYHKQSPRVTVVIPCYNQGEYLGDALDSLEAQTLPFFTVVIVDDGSTDPGTVRVLDRLTRPRLDLRVIRQENSGPAAARNRGISEASTQYILCLDADDTIEPTFLMQAVSLLDSRPDLGVAYTDIRFFGDRNEIVESAEYDLNSLLQENFMVVTSLFRRALWKEAGGFSSELVYGYEDWSLWIAFATMGYYGKRIPEPLFNYRIHGEGRNVIAVRNNLELIAAIRKQHAPLYSDTRLHELWRERRVWRDPQPRAPREERPTPLVSVVIPCFNYGRYVGDAVRSALEQTYPNVEVIVVDDGSTDEDTIRVLREHRWPRTTVFRQENGGLSAARNRGFELAKGDYLLPLDADDMLMPEMIEKCMEVMLSDPTAGWVYTDILFFGDDAGVHKQEDYNLYLELTNNHCTVCALIRKQTWRDAGGYMPNMAKGYEDWNFWVSCSASGWHGRVLDGAYFGYRLHGVSMVTESIKHHQLLINTIRRNHPELFLPWNVEAIRDEWLPRAGDRRHLPLTEASLDEPPPRQREGSPLFSVIVPVYKHHRYLSQCVQSILRQTCQDFELILVDDASQSAAIDQLLAGYAAHPKISVLVNERNLHVSRTLNRGILASRGEYLAFVDCDDFLVPNALERVREYLHTGEAKFFVSTQIIDVDEDGKEVRRRKRSESPRDLLKGNFAGHLKVVRRSVFEVVGLFDPDLSGCQDYDLVLRAQELFPIHFLQEHLYCYRWHPETVSISRQKRQDELAQRIVRWTRYRRWLFDDSIKKSFKQAVTILVTDLGSAPNLAHVTRLLDSTGLPVEVLAHTASDGWTRYTRGRAEPHGLVRTALPYATLQEGRGAIQTPFVVAVRADMTPARGWLESLLFHLTSRQATAVASLIHSAEDGRLLRFGAEVPELDDCWATRFDSMAALALVYGSVAAVPLWGTLMRSVDFHESLLPSEATDSTPPLLSARSGETGRFLLVPTSRISCTGADAMIVPAPQVTEEPDRPASVH